MSAFLGPIHHWLFKKIQYQDQITNRLLDVYDTTALHIRQRLDEKYGVLPQQPLETIIDGGNIHGWLQEKVTLVEYRLAEAVTEILKSQTCDLPALQTFFFQWGNNVECINHDSAKAAFQFLNDMLLDGMPCDRANAVMSESDSQVLWQRNSCVHQRYWDEVGGDIAVYYILRDELIKGMLDKSDFEYEKLENNKYSLTRR